MLNACFVVMRVAFGIVEVSESFYCFSSLGILILVLSYLSNIFHGSDFGLLESVVGRGL